MRNSITDVKAQVGSQTIDLTVFHGSNTLFNQFEFRQRPNTVPLPGIWFAADENYCNSHGQFVYECRVRADGARWLDRPDFLSINAAQANGIVCQIGIDDECNDAIIICNDVRKIEIIRVYDPELGTYIEAVDIENRVIELESAAPGFGFGG
jgi:hypothetical protein